MNAIAITALLLAELLPLIGVPGQQRTTVAGEPCKSCRVRLVPLVNSGAFRPPAYPTAYSMGHDRLIYVTMMNRAIAVFDTLGHLQQTIGPELADAGSLRFPGISLRNSRGNVIVHDAVRGEAFEILPSRKVVQRWQILSGPVAGAVELPSGAVIMSGVSSSTEGAGYPLMRIQDGDVTYFGSSNPILKPGVMDGMRRVLALDPRGGFWAGHGSKYVFEYYGDDGQLRNVVEREASWFVAGEDSLVRPSPTQAPSSWITGLDVDSAGRLWVSTMRAKANFRAWLSAPTVRTDGVSAYPPLPAIAFETVIEVFDPRSGRAIGVSDALLETAVVLRHGFVLTVDLRDSGVPALRVWKGAVNH